MSTTPRAVAWATVRQRVRTARCVSRRPWSWLRAGRRSRAMTPALHWPAGGGSTTDGGALRAAADSAQWTPVDLAAARERGARYGLRGVRVGEASHPSPARRARSAQEDEAPAGGVSRQLRLEDDTRGGQAILDPPYAAPPEEVPIPGSPHGWAGEGNMSQQPQASNRAKCRVCHQRFAVGEWHMCQARKDRRIHAHPTCVQAGADVGEVRPGGQENVPPADALAGPALSSACSPKAKQRVLRVLAARQGPPTARRHEMEAPPSPRLRAWASPTRSEASRRPPPSRPAPAFAVGGFITRRASDARGRGPPLCPPLFFSQAAPRRYARAQGSRCASAKTTAGRGGRVVGQGQASTAHCGHIPRRKCSFTNVSRAERLLPNIDERRALTAQPAELQCC